MRKTHSMYKAHLSNSTDKKGKSITAIIGYKWIWFIKTDGKGLCITDSHEGYFGAVCVLCFQSCFCSPFNVLLYSNNIHEPDRKHQVSETLLVDRSVFWKIFNNILCGCNLTLKSEGRKGVTAFRTLLSLTICYWW